MGTGDGTGGHARSEHAGFEEIKIASLNVNGLRAAAKRRCVFDRLRRGTFDFCLIQESHSTQQEAKIWQTEWGGSAYFCHGSSNSKGVLILMKRDLEFQLIRQIEDREGRVLLLELNIKEISFVLGSLYAPTADAPEEQNRFMDFLEDSLTQISPVNIILGGDLVALDPAQDRQNSTCSPLYGHVMRQHVLSLMEEADLTDVWRYRNQAARKYTFHRGTQASRIDYWLASNHLADLTSTSTIIPVALSDHSIMTLSLSSSPGEALAYGAWTTPYWEMKLTLRRFQISLNP